MPLDPQTGKWVEVGLSTQAPQFSQGRDAELNPVKEYAAASRRQVAEAQMAMRPELVGGKIVATPGGKKSEAARMADANSNAQRVFGKDQF